MGATFLLRCFVAEQAKFTDSYECNEFDPHWMSLYDRLLKLFTQQRLGLAQGYPYVASSAKLNYGLSALFTNPYMIIYIYIYIYITWICTYEDTATTWHDSYLYNQNYTTIFWINDWIILEKYISCLRW